MKLNGRQGIPAGFTLTVFALAVPAASIGARMLDVLEYWNRYRSLGDIIGPRGSSIYGGLLAGFVVAALYSASRGVPSFKLLDAGAPVVALGEAMTRIGCFLNGCCYGVPWNGPWAVIFPRESFAFEDQVASGLIPSTAVHSLPVHPVQLYSMAIMVGVSAYLALAFLRPHREGAIFFRLLIAYGMLRLIVAPFRTEVLASMKTFSVLFIAVGALGLLARQKAPTVAPVARSA